MTPPVKLLYCMRRLPHMDRSQFQIRDFLQLRGRLPG